MFRNLKVGVRMGLAFGLMIFLSSLVALSGVWGAGSLTKGATVSRLVSAIVVDMLEARRAEKNYMLRHEEEYITKHKQYIEKVRVAGGELSRSMDGIADSAEVGNVLKAVDGYADAFRNYLMLDAERVTNDKQRAEAALAALKSLESAKNSLHGSSSALASVAEGFERALQLEQQLRIRSDKEAYGSLEAALQGAAKGVESAMQVSQSAEGRQRLKLLQEAINSYRSTFEKGARLQEQQKEADAVMVREG